MRKMETGISDNITQNQHSHVVPPQHPPATQVKTGTRFDYIAYDETASTCQHVFKRELTLFEDAVENLIKCPRSKALALTKIEEAYMWIGKGIRNDQIARNGSAPLQESRGNS